MAEKEELLEPIKFIRGSMRRRTPIEEELRQARKSPAYWWFKCLEASDVYRSCCDSLDYGELEETYSKFGNIFDYPHFDSWWLKQGRFFFIHQEFLKVVTAQIFSDLLLDHNKVDLYDVSTSF
jgi:hypothetical protein